ncbi:MAG TPA: hypothetical protein VHA52_07195, partial [Candidatus Babeliaceae bacterium]|nr:hypothetical protein [Candidatus Babeliaceae bacterium]
MIRLLRKNTQKFTIFFVALMVLVSLNYWSVFSPNTNLLALGSSVVLYPFLKVQQYCVSPCKSFLTYLNHFHNQEKLLA